MSQKPVIVAFSLVLVLLASGTAHGALKRCFQCRSRGDLGSCKDQFTFNATTAQQEQGVEAIPCASGWCGKVIEGTGSYKQDDYGMATQRMCLQRGPSDGEERCAYTIWNHSKVYMCFCQGDLCNSASQSQIKFLTLGASLLLSAKRILSL
ncbi:uncharacterized protein LOC117642264 [Thrips palmi]|uniref:Uncharacterized protein LOC117642264 n=1 Tax=Thrips palmi TaxID=161013 RepID=A0A6P8Y917_THRPL|nr:uncharacterized protein LOC117642264 [Thrips palmi]